MRMQSVEFKWLYSGSPVTLKLINSSGPAIKIRFADEVLILPIECESAAG